MNNAFQVLSDFLERFGPDVQAHSLEGIPAELRRRLLEFAQGSLSDQGRADLAELLKEQPQWVERLAAEIKSRRPKCERPN